MGDFISTFRKYDHLERLGHPGVRGILDAPVVFVFPKLDGTNASVWYDEHDGVSAGSRNRQLSLDKDNAGFLAWVLSDDPRASALRQFVKENPGLIVYGEWLVPHSLRTYREDSWRRFWVFDVYKRDADRYLSWPEYEDLLPKEVDRILPLAEVSSPSEEQLQALLQRNTFLIKDGKGAGEGIVLKSYFWRNSFDRQPWAKLISNEFKEKNSAAFGVPKIKGEKQVEQEAVEQLATEAFIEKTFYKVVLAISSEMNTDLDKPETHCIGGPRYVQERAEFVQEHRAKIIPRFLGTLWHDFVTEEIWTIAKKFKNPTIDLKRMHGILIAKAKQTLKEVF